MNDFLELFQNHYRHIKLDNKFLRDITKFNINWSQKSDDYIDFLSQGLTGVHPIRFSTIDEDMLFKILKSNRRDVLSDVKKLDGVDPSWTLYTNPTYLSLLYIMYLVINSNLRDRDKEEYLIQLHFTYSVKTLGSILFRFFPYNTPEHIAKTVYEKLSNRFIVKREGNWRKTIRYRAKDILRDGVYYDRLKNLNLQNAMDIINGINTAYKSMVKSIYTAILEVKENEDSISVTSVLGEDVDGNIAVKDDIQNYSKISDYILRILPYSNDFHNKSAVILIHNISKNVEQENISIVVRYLSDNADNKTRNLVEKIIKLTMDYLHSKEIFNQSEDILKTLNMAKGYWSTGNRELKNIKEYIKNICYKATGRKTSWLLSSLTISVIIYIYLRAIVREKLN